MRLVSLVADKAAQAMARLENERRRLELQTEHIPVPVPAEDKRCPACADGGRFAEVGEGKLTSILEYVPGYFRRRVFHRQTVACTCGKHIVTAPVPDKAFDRTQYGPKFIAWLVVTKCCDAAPISRQHPLVCRARHSVAAQPGQWGLRAAWVFTMAFPVSGIEQAPQADHP